MRSTWWKLHMFLYYYYFSRSIADTVREAGKSILWEVNKLKHHVTMMALTPNSLHFLLYYNLLFVLVLIHTTYIQTERWKTQNKIKIYTLIDSHSTRLLSAICCIWFFIFWFPKNTVMLAVRRARVYYLSNNFHFQKCYHK